MRPSKRADIRAYLLSLEDGASVTQIAKAVGSEYDAVRRALKQSMPDAYIDRWNRVPHGVGRSKYEAVWDVVRVPPNCPRPD